MPPALHLSEPWPAWVAGHGRARLAREALAPYVTAQRWFPARARTLSALTIEDAVALDQTGESGLLLVAVEYADGGRHRFAMPVALAARWVGSHIHTRLSNTQMLKLVSLILLGSGVALWIKAAQVGAA